MQSEISRKKWIQTDDQTSINSRRLLMDHHFLHQHHRPPPLLPPPPPPFHPLHHYNNQYHPNFHDQNNPIFMQNNHTHTHTQNPPFFFQNPNFSPQNPTNFPLLPNPVPQNRNFIINNVNNNNLEHVCADKQQMEEETVSSVSAEVEKIVSEVNVGVKVAEVEAIVEKVQSDMIAGGEDVVVWKVSCLVLRKLEAVSWSSLGVGIHDVPSLHRLVLSEAKTVKGSVGTFITSWKEACTTYMGVELFDKILDFYMIKKGTRKELISCFSASPLVGSLNLAVISIRKGTWDNLSKTFQFNSEPLENVNKSIRKFVRNWKEACQKFTVAEALEKMLESCQFETRKRNILRHIFSNFPLVGFLDVTVKSIRSGAWDSLCDTCQSSGELGQVIKQADALAGCKSVCVEPIEKDSDVPIDDLTCRNDLSVSLGGSPAEKQQVEEETVSCVSAEVEEIVAEVNVGVTVAEVEAIGQSSGELGQVFKQADALAGCKSVCIEPIEKDSDVPIDDLTCHNDLSVSLGCSPAEKQQVEEETVSCVSAEVEEIVAEVNVSVTVAEVEAIVEKVQSEMIAVGEDVFVWKVSCLVLRTLEEASWSSLGVGIHDVPSLRRLVLSEAKTVKGSVGMFISSWKEACTTYMGVELFDKTLDFYEIRKGTRKELVSCFSSSPLVGLLNLAVMSIQKGTWDSPSNTFQFNSEPLENVDKSIRKFVRKWKEACRKFTAAEALKKMLEPCQKKNILRHIFSNFPLVGFLDVAVKSIRSGAWDSLCDTCQSSSELGQVIKQADVLAGCKSVDVEPIQKDSDVPSDGLTCHSDLSVSSGGPAADINEKVASHQQAECDFNEQEAARIIESIRREEFGLDPNSSDMESSMLKKQRARLGRALHCLSEELYSRDSHFLLELIQNADDNLYPENVEPTLTFILQPTGIAVLNNERGFTAENIRALCNVGNSTKKGSSTGHIGQKGIGFKSVFRITDAPEIHSNGFHVKFDTSENQLGSVLPTILPPCGFEMFQIPAFGDHVEKGTSSCNTCIFLPFKRKLLERTSLSRVASMFSDVHPSLLLFLRRLQCVKLRNMLDDSYIVMRKEIAGDGIVRVSFGKEKMTWFVTSTKLHPEINSSSVRMTEISIALMLKETENGVYEPVLQHQPVFAFLPLRTYGLKFILQADFVLPSSREEVDQDSPWNKWLLSEFPSFFVNAEKSLCSLPCFRENPAKAVSVYMSFVPLIGEVQGFFSKLPEMIISKLSRANCLLEDGSNDKWVPPCKVLRGWNAQARSLLPGNLLYEHLGVWFLHKDIDLPDTLATALGIQKYGPEMLTKFIVSLGRVKDGIKSMGLGWLFSWLNELRSMVLAQAPNSEKLRLELDLIKWLRTVPFVPLSNGTYSSLDEGTIWVHDYASTLGHGKSIIDAFPLLNATLRTVNPALFSESSHIESKFNCMRMLQNIGVRLMSAHELIRIHILPSISNDRFLDNDHQLMLEYITFVMVHLQSTCIDCHDEKDHIIAELRSKAVILTNHGYKRLDEVPIHFSREFGNSVDTSKFLHGLDYKWHEIDTVYLKNRLNESMKCGLTQWREFFQKLGVTDFIKVVLSEKSITVSSPAVLKQIIRDKNLNSSGLFVEDWESPELFDILYRLSTNGSHEGCKYVLEILDAQWDDHFSDKATGYCSSIANGNKLYFMSSFLACISDIKWVVSSVDSELHFPRELFYDCDAVRSILGCHAPYAVPKIRSAKLLTEIGFKIQVTLDDALAILKTWRSLKSPFTASLSQMSKFYSFISKEMAASRQQVVDAFTAGPFIFVPFDSVKLQDDVVTGSFLSMDDVYWHDSTAALDHIEDINVSVLQNSCLSKKEKKKKSAKNNTSSIHLSKALSALYPSLHNFFVIDCRVNEAPSYHQYLQKLKSLSKIPLSQGVAKAVFRIFLWWSFGLECNSLRPAEIIDLKSCISQHSVLPALQHKWVSADPPFWLVCWCDDDNLKTEFDHSNSLIFLYFGELTDKETEMLNTKVSVLLRKLGIRSLSEIVSREAVCDGAVDSVATTSMVKRVLPFALRYLYNLHPESYNQHKLSGFDKLRQLRIVTVEKLFCRNVIIIKTIRCISKKQSECSSMLQDNILYTTKDTDPHSVFMELSCLLIDGTPNLHLTNFLHMMTLMVGSNSTHEQIERFLLNNQKMVKLPNEDLSLLIPLYHFELPESASIPIVDEQVSCMSKEKSTLSGSPTVWKPKTGTKTQTVVTNENGKSGKNDDVSDGLLQEKPDALPNLNDVLGNQTDLIDDLTQSESGKTELLTIMSESQKAMQTGRQGEEAAFQYYTDRAEGTVVNWVNREKETGLPYDIMVGEEASREYIEVKASRNARKSWFQITKQEWQFATEKGDGFSVAHVILSDQKLDRLTVYKNPVKLCQTGVLRLVTVSSKCYFLQPVIIDPI
ncbi:hypothetical protein RND81_08G175800 [Saponaria officinalis]|uniref:Protein NO VEIN C-terminal domain-containing protein n=1 Tax=Saponaria officinalis TaxID=3572 RepID=A0AAW1JA75_SAPOF